MANVRPDELIKDPASLSADRNRKQGFQETATDYAFDPLGLRKNDPLGRLAGKNYYATPEPIARADALARQTGVAGYAAGSDRLNDLMADQGELNQMLLDRASGRTPSVAEMQTRQAIADAAANTRAQAAGARGINRVSAQRQAMATSADLSGRAAEMGAIQRLQEQQAATNALQQQQGLQAQTVNNAQNQAITLQELGQRGQMSAEQLAQQTAEGNARRKGELKTGLLQGAGSVLGMLSDIRAKEKIIPVGVNTSDEQIRDLLADEPGVGQSGPSAEMLALVARNQRARDQDRGVVQVNQLGLTPEQMQALEARRMLATAAGSKTALQPVSPYLYQYKPAAAASMGTDTAPRAGVMAQDLEKSPLLQDLVEDTPGGKVIDGPKALSANLAMAAGLDKRLRKLEGKRAA
jgi:hypothetical protein